MTVSKKLHVVTSVTKSYMELYEGYFLGTLPSDVEEENLHVFHLPDKFDNCRSKSSLLAELEKVRLENVYNLMIENMGDNIFYIDVDVAFATGASFVEEINNLLLHNDIVFQFKIGRAHV